ncbi:preprotein translocase subunit SecG [Flexithrix dorotheae]|uniref:preprotein translocase subunit SecG n=1 Tax=Flexithrix dorotheae TaxID=70993 RepID=UPI00037190B1|nr:preprotein translocase subunit SecG [Flexithrix dorotheae]
MTTFIIILILFVAILLVLLVLAQDSKGSGLTGNIGSASQIMGTRRTMDWIEKATWTLVSLFFVLCLGVAATIDKGQSPEGFTSPNIEKAKEEASPIMQQDVEVPEEGEDEINTDELLAPEEETPAASDDQ